MSRLHAVKLAGALVMMSPIVATAQSAAPATRADPASLPDPAAVLTLLNNTAKAQIAVLQDAPHFVPQRSGGAGATISSNWIAATFLIGLGRLAQVSDEAGARAYIRTVAEHYNFGMLGSWNARSRIDADTLAIGAVYQELYAHSGEPGEIGPLRERLDFNLPYLQIEPAPERLTWWWCDALFMAPPVLARMSAQTGDHSYLQAMDVQWWRTYDRLWSKEHGLFFRDERFRTRVTKNGKPVFWGRGNGWVVAGIARTLETMPENWPSRPRYVQLFQTMMASIARLQRADGLWTTNLLDPEDPSGPESSGSAFYTYAMAWGINHGLLDRKTYQPRVLRAWAGLTAAIQPDGLLGYAQRAGDQPVPAKASDHALYGTGGLLLAGVEMLNLGKPVSPLPLAEPRPDPTPQPRVGISMRSLPNDATPEQRKEWERAMAERQAMIDLGYDPKRDGPGAPAPIADGVARPKITLPLAPPPEAERVARASVKYAPYRFDDILWENDRTAHRIYGPALEREEPPSTSGIDAWGKNVVWPFMERQLRTGKQHDYHGEGIDFYNVNTFRGAGGLGIWAENKLWVSRNWAKYRILKDGPDVADFEVDYAPWPVGVDRKVWETRRFTLPLGTNFTRMVSTIGSDSKAPLLAAIGVSKRATSQAAGTWMADAAKGRFSFWSPEDPDKGAMGVALIVDPAMVAEVRQDADNYLVVLRVTPGKPFVYYSGAAWSKGLDFHDRGAWEAYVLGAAADFGVE